MAAKRTYKTNAGNKTGRPLKGFEAYRKRALEAEPIYLEDYIKQIFESIEKDGGEYTLGIVDEGNNWHEYVRGMRWTDVRVLLPGRKLIYVSIDELSEDYEIYKAEFNRRRLAIAFN